AEGTAEELKRLVPGGHVRLRFSDPTAYRSATAALTEAGLPQALDPARAGDTPIDEALTLQIPSDGSQRALRAILDRLDTAGIEADELTVHTPDLDDVFFALTGSKIPAQSTRSAQSAQPNQSKDAVR
ncbi:ABC transporter, partial [Streptomyces sp. NPDC059352]